MKINYAVIVDGYSSGGEFAQQLKQEGIACIHIQSNLEIPPVYKSTFKPEDYVLRLIYNSAEGIECLMHQLMPYQPLFIIPGAEPGIELADTLSYRFNLDCNEYALSPARRDKYLMQQRIAAFGLAAIPQIKSSNLAVLKEWAVQQCRWPLVVKPLNSAGGDGVAICYNLTELAAAYSAIMSEAVNMLLLPNTEVLLQHYIAGEEFVVNTVSKNGRHVLCEIWKYKRFKSATGYIYDSASLCEYCPEQRQSLITYAYQVADSLGIRFGAMHAEIILNEGNPILVEAAARVMGGNLPMVLLSGCLKGRNQSTMNLLSYAQPEKFDALASQPYQLAKHMTAVFLVAHQSGILNSINYLLEIKALPSFQGIKLRIKPGDAVVATVNYETSPGMLYLAHENADVLERDIKIIREYEKNGMYQLQ